MRARILISGVAIALLGVSGFTTLDALSEARAEQSARKAVREQVVTFTVENMTCGLCPVTVKKAMEGVAGVKSVAIDFETKTATVVFDASRVAATEIAAASRRAGYPAKPAG